MLGRAGGFIQAFPPRRSITLSFPPWCHISHQSYPSCGHLDDNL